MTVYLVGAGPGDPGLLTRRGAALLARADVVVHDRLANPELLALAPASAERISVGKAPGRVEMDQDAITALLVERGRRGETVVRLKGGDPFVFGRGGEEAEALLAAGVPFEVVPGVTSAIAAPAYAGVPVTHRGLSTHVTIVTGHEQPGGSGAVDWEALARAGGTLVVLMGAGNLPAIVDRLLAGGLPPDTPVAAVRHGTRPDQRTVRATLATIAAAGVEAPSAIVIGPVAGLDLGWFERRPLFGRSVLVTRARAQASELSGRLAELGAEVLELPVIAIEPLRFAAPDLSGTGWLVFTSANGVEHFFERGLGERDVRALAGWRIAAVGPATAAALAARGVRADLVPREFVAESFVAAFPDADPPGTRVLVAGAQETRAVLPDGLRAKGYAVEVLPVYRTERSAPSGALLDRIRRGELDAITFTSSSTVTNLLEVLGGLPDPMPLVACIGPATAATARAAGWPVDVEAEEHTIDGLVAAVCERVAAATQG